MEFCESNSFEDCFYQNLGTYFVEDYEKSYLDSICDMDSVVSTIDTEINSVNHPKHYNFGSIEVIDAIESWGLGFSLGNAIKYVARAGKKSKEREVEDLQKAIWYINRHISTLK